MENFNANQAIITEPFGDVNFFPLDQIWPDGTGQSEPESFASPSLLPEQVSIQLFAGDNGCGQKQLVRGDPRGVQGEAFG